MKKQLLLILAVSAFISGCGFMDTAPCAYKEYEAVITIKEIQRQASNTALPESPQETLRVIYTFESEGHASPPSLATISGQLNLKREEVEQKGIKVGKQYYTKATYTEEKTCAPGPFIEGFDKWKEGER